MDWIKAALLLFIFLLVSSAQETEDVWTAPRRTRIQSPLRRYKSVDSQRRSFRSLPIRAHNEWFMFRLYNFLRFQPMLLLLLLPLVVGKRPEGWAYNLTCLCTRGASPHCPDSDSCDAVTVGLGMLHKYQDKLAFIYQEGLRSQFAVLEPDKRREICDSSFAAFNDTREVLVLDAETWIPACIRIPSEGDFKTCGLAPNRTSFGRFSQEGIRRRRAELYNILDCGGRARRSAETHPLTTSGATDGTTTVSPFANATLPDTFPRETYADFAAEFSGEWHYCRDEDGCNRQKRSAAPALAVSLLLVATLLCL